MGKLLIELPLKVNRRYKISDKNFAIALVNALETVRRIKNSSKLSRKNLEDLEDASDICAANHALAKGEFVSWEDATAFLDR
jgi:hypothetical protein